MTSRHTGRLPPCSTAVQMRFGQLFMEIYRVLASSVLGSVIVNTPSRYLAAASSSTTGQGSVSEREELP
jgi:hypothetical protein